MVRATADYAGGDFFRVLGVAPELGRTFAADEHEHVAVIGHALWQGLLQGRADVLGQPIDIDGTRCTIVGVMPAGFSFPAGAVAWTPFLEDVGPSRTAHNFQGLARLRSAAGLGQARLEAGALAARLKARFGDATDAVGFDVTPLGEAIAAPVRGALLLLAAGTAFLLLIAVTNAANLLLAMNGARARERAVRAALGASNARLARQVMLESLLLAAAAAAIALPVARAAIRVLAHVAGASLPRAADVHLDLRIAVLGLLVAAGMGALSGAAVLWSGRGRDPVDELRGAGRGQSASRGHLRSRALLLGGQTALTTILLVGAGLLARSFLALLAVDPGFDAEGAASVQVSLPAAQDDAGAAANARRHEALMASIARLPGVAAVGGVNSLPLTPGGANGGFWDGSVTRLDPAPPTIGYAEFRVASAGYFRSIGIPVLKGRVFTDGDRSDGQQVAVVSAAAARAAWGERDPIGQRIQYGNMDGDMHALTVVGVVGDVHERRLDRAAMGTVYVDLDQRPRAAADFSIVVRSSLPLATLMPGLRGLLARDAGDVPHDVQALSEVRSAALADRRFSLLLLGAFSAVALVLAIGGLYGLMAFAVGLREQEFAVRQALGASRRQIARLVLGSGLRVGAAGVAVGLLAALAGTRVLASHLYGIPPHDLVTLAGVSAILLATLSFACLVPARRACAVAPRAVLG
jgi:predicted permease